LSRLADPVAPAASAGEAAGALYTLYRSRMYAYCVGQLRDRQEADDAVQTTFLYAFAMLERGVVPRAELPWLYTIAHNVCRTRRRSLKRRSRHESGVDLETLHEVIGRPDETGEELEGLGASLASLPENQRQALLLREWQGLSYDEIGLRLGLSQSAVEAVLFRARRSLAQRMRQQTPARLGAAVNVGFLLGALRKLGAYAATTKAATAALAVGVAAGVAALPAADTASRLRAPSPPRTTHTTFAPPPTAPARPVAPAVQDRGATRAAAVRHAAPAPSVASRQAAADAALPPVLAQPAASAVPPAQPTSQAGPVAAAPRTDTPLPPSPAPPAAGTDTPTQPASPAPPAAATDAPKLPLPPPVDHVVPPIDQVVAALPQLPPILPQLPQLPPTPTTPVDLTHPLPSLPQEGTPIQAGK
jgi:RNA polymerase sigma factor (sigma-70 family)